MEKGGGINLNLHQHPLINRDLNLKLLNSKDTVTVANWGHGVYKRVFTRQKGSNEKMPLRCIMLSAEYSVSAKGLSVVHVPKYKPSPAATINPYVAVLLSSQENSLFSNTVDESTANT